MRDIARAFLAPGADGVLAQTRAGLRNIAQRQGAKIPWTVGPANPVLTRLSYGGYQRETRGERCVFAEITFVWDLTPVRQPGNTQAAKAVLLEGRTSTVIRLLEGDPAEDPVELGMWRMEVANDDSPGAYFHVQIMGRDDDMIFPKAVDVPRLPSLLVSPFACLEFIIAELFQDEWDRHSVRSSGAMDRWRSVQSRRMLKQLKWHAEQIEHSSGSPWSAWKRATPHMDIFNSA